MNIATIILLVVTLVIMGVAYIMLSKDDWKIDEWARVFVRNRYKNLYIFSISVLFMLFSNWIIKITIVI